jgi:hypothetical protein
MLAVRAVDVPVIMRVVVVVVAVMGVIVMTVTMVMVAMIVATMGVSLMPMVVTVTVTVVVMMIVPAGAVVVRRRLLLGTERALERRGLAALAANQFRHHRIVQDVERLGRHLGLDVVAAELPGEAGQADRVLGRDREQGLAGGEDAHQATILQAHRVAILEGRRPVEVEPEGEAALGGQLGAAAGAGGMVEGDLVGDGVGAHGGFADDGGGALHRVLAVMPGISPLL